MWSIFFVSESKHLRENKRKMNGYELHDKMKKIDDKVKVCFISAAHIDLEMKKKYYSKTINLLRDPRTQCLLHICRRNKSTSDKRLHPMIVLPKKLSIL
jgi:hypothetical protein